MSIHPSDIPALQAASCAMTEEIQAEIDAELGLARQPEPEPTAGPGPAAALEPIPAPAPPPALPPARHDGWSLQKQVRFLEALAATHTVAEATREVGMSRQSAYRLRARLRGEPFDLAWDAAFQTHFDALTEVAMERAINGVQVAHLHKGEIVHTSRKFDERLTIALLAQRLTPRRLRLPPWHPAADYDVEDFRALVARAARGSETWRGGQAADPAALIADATTGPALAHAPEEKNTTQGVTQAKTPENPLETKC